MSEISKPKLTPLESLSLLLIIASTLLKSLFTLIAAPFRGDTGNKDYRRHVAHTALRTMNGQATAKQLQAINLSTNEAYASFIKTRNMRPVIVSLPTTSGNILWIGNPRASKVLILLGGGFVYPANSHFQYYWELRRQSGLESSLSIAFLSYSLAPDSQYPTQLAEAVDLLRYLIEKRQKEPDNIIISGDSAGANLGLGIISHLLHPHPSILPLKLSSPIGGLALISPWVTLQTSAKSSRSNALRDVVSKEVLNKWGSYVLGGAALDEYNAPLAAQPTWWKDIQTVVHNILLTGGRNEVIFDDIQEFEGKIKESARDMQVVFTDETHDQPLLDPQFGIKKECESSKVFKSWVTSIYRR
ncbi:alpha/beta-hydrolase [Daldinia sp. FL1419]|nr:alpha/beta-hydrolase [Daldinia sp. FL1419]